MATKRKHEEATDDQIIISDNDNSTSATASRQRLAQYVNRAITGTIPASTPDRGSEQPSQFVNGNSSEINHDVVDPKASEVSHHIPLRTWTDASTRTTSQPVYICVSLNDADPLGVNIKGVTTSNPNQVSSPPPTTLGQQKFITPKAKMLRIQEVVPGSQSDVAGLKVGDVVVSAMVGGSAIKWSEFMSFGAFVSVVKSAQRPILLQVRRDLTPPQPSPLFAEMEAEDKWVYSPSAASPITLAGAVANQLQSAFQLVSVSTTSTKNQLPAMVGKRGRPKKVLSKEESAERKKINNERLKVMARQQQLEKLAILRQSRLGIIRAFDLRVAADEIEQKNFGSSTTMALDENINEENNAIDNSTQDLGSVAQETIRKTILSMREEANELWEHPLHEDWERDFKTLLQFKQDHGHCAVDEQNSEGYPNLWKFARNVKKRFMHYTPRKQCIQEIREMEAEVLKRIGFVCPELRVPPKPRTWDEMFEQLKGYKEKHGTCHIPVGKPRPPYKELALWVAAQRFKYKQLQTHPADQPRAKDMLTAEQEELLVGVGFSWTGQNTMRSFEKMFEELKEYKEKHGTCHVPVSSPRPQYKELSQWVSHVRRKNKELKKLPEDAPRPPNMLTDEQFDLLNEMGFSWDAKSRPWDDMFRLLEEYKEKHGDCLVPVGRPKGPNKPLARWVAYQRYKQTLRTRYLKNPESVPKPPHMITGEQIQRLTDLGFVWRALPDKTWEEFYQELIEFKNEHGHVNVPQLYPKNRKLGSWVHRHRRLKRTNENGTAYTPFAFSAERQRLLEEIGFIWMTKPTPKRDWSKTKKRKPQKKVKRAVLLGLQLPSDNDTDNDNDNENENDNGNENDNENENGNDTEYDNENDNENYNIQEINDQSKHDCGNEEEYQGFSDAGESDGGESHDESENGDESEENNESDGTSE